MYRLISYTDKTMPFMYILTIYGLLYYYYAHIRADESVVIYDEFPWTKVETALTTLCPPLEICDRRLNGTVDPIVSCCTGCSCDEDCNVTGACCLVDRGFQEYAQCVYPRTKYHNGTFNWEGLVQSYMIITKPPMNGCDTKHSSGCSSDDFTKLSPVSDDDTGSVYFDVDCALCHGIRETKPWKPIFNCLHVIRVDRIDVADEVDKYFKNPNKSQCYFTFMPNPGFNVRHSACQISRSTEWLNDNSEKLKVATSLNLSMDDIKELCYSNINMPFKSVDSSRWFINPFCYLYDGGRVAEGCRLDDRILNPDNYGILFDYDKVNHFQTMDRNKRTSTKQLCFPLEKFRNVNEESRCRQTHCPTGRLFDQNGECILVMNNVHVALNGRIPLYINIKLTPITGDNYTYEDLLNVTVDDISQALSLKESWYVSYIGYIPANISKTIRSSELIVLITLTKESLEPSLEKIKSYMKHSVTLNISGHLIRFSQSFYHQMIKTNKDRIKEERDLKIPYQVLNVFQPWIPIRILSDRIDGIVISKLYFCEQIELQLAEFELYIKNHVLYNNVTDTYMYDLEFKILRDDIGFVTRARLCVEDAKFVHLTKGCSSTQSVYVFSILSIFTIIMLN